LRANAAGISWTEYSYEEDGNELLETKHILETIEVGGVYTVNDVEYSNVVVVEESLYYTEEEGLEPYSVQRYYYAKGVGLIKIEDDFSVITELINYTIK
jgi:hypothetical protein